MLAILPLIALIFLVLIFHQTGSCWRSAVLSALLTWGVLVTFITEALSIFKLITFHTLLFVWTSTNLTLLVAYLKTIGKEKTVINFNKLNRFSTVLIVSIIAIVVTIGSIALIAPPNTWDSMTYHMSRVVHWIQNQSVAHYPTSYPPQLYHPPFAEFAIMHLQILSGGDRFANLVQWFSMVGSIIGVSLIAEQLGANQRGQLFASVTCATIPMGILQGSSTQNDYVVCFWLVCFVYYILLSLAGNINLANELKVGASLGLAIFTKTTAYIFAFPFLVWFLYSGLKNLRLKFVKYIIVIFIVVNVINLGYYLRNLALSGSLLGAPPEFVQEYKAEIFGIRILISNIIKNLSLHIATPVPSLNRSMENIIHWLHNLIGINLFGSGATSHIFWINSLINHEDMAGNLIHLFLILTVIWIFILHKKLRNQPKLNNYILAITGAFLLFCLMTKFQQFNSRHHLHVFVLFSALIGVFLSKVVQVKIVNYVAAFLILSSLPWVLFNESRPMIMNSKFVEKGTIENIFNTSRIDQYFSNRRGLKKPYKEVANFVNSIECSEIGLILQSSGTSSENNWEYPLWVLLKRNSNDKFVRIEHVNAQNYSSVFYEQYPYNNFMPNCIISNQPKETEKEIANNSKYVEKFVSVPFKVFVKQEAGANDIK